MTKHTLKDAQELLIEFKEPQIPTDDFLKNKYQEPKALARYIDHTLLQPQSNLTQFDTLLQEAVDFGFYALCVQPVVLPYLKKIWQKFADIQVAKAVVIGFPHGVNLTDSKVDEVKQVLQYEVDEIDFVAPLFFIKSQQWNEVERELCLIREAAPHKTLKMIFETSLLSDSEVACLACLGLKCQIDYFKTSTGFNGGGATHRSVALLKHFANHQAKVKASGGIRDLWSAFRMIELGADRIGCSSAAQFMASLAG